MKNFVKKKALLSALFCLSAVAIEFLTFRLMGLSVLPKYFALDLTLIMAVGVVIFCLPHLTAAAVAASVIIAAQSVVSFCNVNLFWTYGDIFSWDLIEYAKEAVAVISFNTIKPVFLIGYIVLAVAYGAGLFAVCYFVPGSLDKRRQGYAMMAMVFLVAAIFAPTAYMAQLDRLYVDTESTTVIRANDKELYRELKYKNAFFYKFGTYPMYFKNIILGQRVGAEADDIDQSLLYDYYNVGKTAPRTEYWGLDSGNNLVVVMLESMDEVLLHPKYTPVLSGLMGKSINFTNYHAQAKTDISEASVVLGSYPSAKNLVSERDEIKQLIDGDSGGTGEVDISGALGFSLPNRLKAAGFDTTAYFHPSLRSFYGRGETHNNYGFDRLFFEDSYSHENFGEFDYIEDWSYPEAWFVRSAADDMFPTEGRFFSFMTTINAHGAYGTLSPHSQKFFDKIDDKDFADIEEESYYLTYKRALSEAMVVDEGIAEILSQLKSRGLEDNTTLLVYADHNAYMDDISYLIKGTTTHEPDSFRIPAFVYSPNLAQGVEVDKFMVAFDLMPTVMQLLGIDYNPDYYMGISAFEESESVMISKIGGIFNDIFYTTDAIEVLYSREGATQEQFSAFQAKYLAAADKQKVINMLYEYGCPPIKLQ